MSEKSKNPSTIQSEEQFQDIVIAERATRARVDYSKRFVELEKALHDTLKRQDSDGALTLITK